MFFSFQFPKPTNQISNCRFLEYAGNWRNLIGWFLGGWKLKNTDFSQKIKTQDWCISLKSIVLLNKSIWHLWKSFSQTFVFTVTKPNNCDEAVNKLIHLMDKSTFIKTEFRQSEDIYRNRISNDVKDLDVLTSDEMKSGYHYLYSRYS